MEDEYLDPIYEKMRIRIQPSRNIRFFKIENGMMIMLLLSDDGYGFDNWCIFFFLIGTRSWPLFSGTLTTVKNKRINVRVEKKVEELDGLHKRHLSRPNLDEDGGEETKIQKLTQEATAVSFLFLNF